MPTRVGANILLEDIHGRVAFQPRDNRPDVSYPDYWGLFGGWLEPGETPEQAIQREMAEELELTLDAARLEYLNAHRDGDVISHVFRYPAPSELANATLREGQRLELLSLSDLQTRRVVPRHKTIWEWYQKPNGTEDHA